MLLGLGLGFGFLGCLGAFGGGAFCRFQTQLQLIPEALGVVHVLAELDQGVGDLAGFIIVAESWDIGALIAARKNARCVG